MLQQVPLVAGTTAPDGAHLSLMRRDRIYVIFAGGKILMSNRMPESEAALAQRRAPDSSI